MSELINFRDFGGYQTKDGRRVKKDTFYRCGSYRDLTEEDRDYLRSLNIQHLLDYRELTELDSDEQRESFAKNVHTISASAHLGLFETDKTVPYTILTTESMDEFYKKLPFSNPAYINMFNILLEDGATPYLHNCTAGKDRTGLATSLILLALDVKEDIVTYEYMLSMDAYDAIVENERRRMNGDLTEETLYYKIPGLIIRPSYLQASFDEIRRVYGTFDHYFEEEFGLTREKRDQLKEMYTI
ncbi:tyrosine-protein phosphatase [Erysipelothrix inopinata]|uniref:Tyrosine-protein phosphatase n=1 Tax=Erysipelothrix inopinata TaxID=225084 RepID=A0A7G9S008_9FIRM|nr:tyrosine-protein phosphatase [Erysipelothrix inopinata]QNN61183.1 tyrosine-protein phosphatase [Erysipelothrix inopinata]